jgi:hypothetical protein
MKAVRADLHGVDEDRVVVRGRTYERPVPVPSPAPPRVVDARSRWRRSDVSFGLFGRLVCTAVALVPVWRFLATGSVFWFLVTISAIGPAVLWLRDTWRRT